MEKSQRTSYALGVLVAEAEPGLLDAPPPPLTRLEQLALDAGLGPDELRRLLRRLIVEKAAGWRTPRALASCSECGNE
jgi:hypothetical protein